MLEEKSFDTGSVTINYGEGPASAPPLVLLHGGAGRWHSFLTVLPQLVPDWHVYALDHRGHGPSGRVAGAYRAVDYAQDTVAFVRNRISEPAVLWGQSLGANIAIAVAAQAPESVRAVVLEEPGIELSDPGPFEAFLRQMRDLASSGRPAEEILVDLAELPLEVPGLDAPVRLGDVRQEDYLRLTAECLSQLEPEVLTFMLDGRLVEGYDVEALLQQVACPALLIQGEPAFGGLEDEVAGRAFALLPRGQRVKVPGAGHNIHRTQPEAALQAAMQFLESVPEADA